MTSLISLCTTLGTQWDHLLSLALLVQLTDCFPGLQNDVQQINTSLVGAKFVAIFFHLCIISRNKCVFFLCSEPNGLYYYIFKLHTKNSHLIEKVMMQHVGQSGLPAVLLLSAECRVRMRVSIMLGTVTSEHMNDF